VTKLDASKNMCAKTHVLDYARIPEVGRAKTRGGPNARNSQPVLQTVKTGASASKEMTNPRRVVHQAYRDAFLACEHAGPYKKREGAS